MFPVAGVSAGTFTLDLGQLAGASACRGELDGKGVPAVRWLWWANLQEVAIF